MISNWCEICEDVCHDHPTICSICGAALTTPPNDTVADSTMEHSHEQLLQEMREASRDLRDILGNLRGQVEDLDVLTQNIMVDQENGLPQEVWDPQHASSGPVTRPTSKEALTKIPRLVLNEYSTIFRQATLRINADLNFSGVCSTTPAIFEAGDNGSTQQITKASSDVSDLSRSKSCRNVDCTLGEFGSTDEYMFEMGTSLVLASPVTGKGGLDKQTKTQISQLKASANNVVLFMQRGGGLTFVQKACMAQNAGASAVIIGNNMANPWPYVMKDSKGESKKPGQSLSIPVAMIKEGDGLEIKKLFEKRKKFVIERQQKRLEPPIPNQIILENEKLSTHAQLQTLMLQRTFSSQDDSYDDGNNIHDFSLSCEFIVKAQSSDCPVCCEQMRSSETVVQLPGCGHIFHEECALHWLKSHNTCPYCRRELPTDDPEYERERRQRQGGTGNGNTNNGGSFYG